MFNSPMLLDFNSNGNNQQKRSKITKACDNCRRRRVKCDGVPDGCGGCKAAKTQCVYTTSNTKRGPPKGYVEVIEDRLGKIENMLVGIVKRKKNIKASSSSTDKATAAPDTSATPAAHSDIEDGQDEEDDDHASTYSSDLVKVKQQPCSPALSPARSCTPSARNIRSGSVAMSPLGRHSPLMSRNRSLTSLFPFSQDNLPHESGSVSHTDINALTDMFGKLGTTSVRTTVPFPWLTPEQSRQYGRNHLQFSPESLEPPLPTLSRSFAPSISPDQTLQLLNSYFDRFNVFLPIIHRPTFMSQWEQQTPISPLLLNALLAVAAKVPSTGSKMTAEDRQQTATNSQAFFDAARLLLDEFMDVPRVSTVQALCLMSQFHHQGQWKATRSSSYLSMAIRMAHELGLHRDPENVGRGPEADGLRYLWWSMFIMVCGISSQMCNVDVSHPRRLVINQLFLLPFHRYHTIGSPILGLDGLGLDDARKGERCGAAHGSYIVTARSSRLRLHGPSCQGKKKKKSLPLRNCCRFHCCSLKLKLNSCRICSSSFFPRPLDSWKRPTALLLDPIVAAAVWWP